MEPCLKYKMKRATLSYWGLKYHSLHEPVLVLSVRSYHIFSFFLLIFLSNRDRGLKKKSDTILIISNDFFKNPFEIVKKKTKNIYFGGLFFSIGEDCYSVKKIFVHDKSEVDALLPFWCLMLEVARPLFFCSFRNLISTCGREYLEILSQK